MINELIFDVETQKLFGDLDDFDPGKLGVSIVSVYWRKLNEAHQEIEGKITSFWEKELDKMWPLFQEAERIIGFNSVRFDVPVLQPYTNIPLSKLKHFDILEKVKESAGRRLSLDTLAKDTLGTSKIDVGLNAVYYWQRGDTKSLEKLKKYCEHDVLITKKLYDFGLSNGQLKYTDKWNTPRTIEIDFSYPPKDKNEQPTLF